METCNIIHSIRWINYIHISSEWYAVFRRMPDFNILYYHVFIVDDEEEWEWE